MKFLFDTQLLLWSGNYPELLSSAVVDLIQDSANEIVFSTASVWEVAIKFSRGRPDFQVEPSLFRKELFAADFLELPVLGEHAIAVAGLPPIHKDPFDRILIAQAIVEGITLLTANPKIAQYPGPIQLV